MQLLISDYLLLERYYMEQSIKKAITMDTCDNDALVSTMVDDIFFIVKKCIRFVINREKFFDNFFQTHLTLNFQTRIQQW